jgi:hypothetical protein
MVYFRQFILIIVDSLRFKNRNTGGCFFVPKAVFGVAHFLVLTGIETLFKVEVKVLKSGMEMVYILWTAVAVVAANLRVDPTERYKWNIYVGAGAIALAILAVVHVLFVAMSRFRTSAVGFIVNYGVANVFALLMAYLHWPYEVVGGTGGAAEGGTGRSGDAEPSRVILQVVDDQRCCKRAFEPFIIVIWRSLLSAIRLFLCKTGLELVEALRISERWRETKGLSLDQDIRVTALGACSCRDPEQPSATGREFPKYHRKSTFCLQIF